MFKQPSDTLKQKSTNARRAATTLRTLGEAHELDRADQGVLLKAAQILEAYARCKTNEAKSAKATEVAFEKARTKAAAELKRAIDAWPIPTTIDQVAFAQLADRQNEMLRRQLDDPFYHTKPDGPRWLLNNRLEDARREVVGSAAYDVAKSRTTPADAIAALRAKFDAARAHPETHRLAARIDKTPAEKAAA